MKTTDAAPVDDLTTLLPDWRRHLRALNRSPATIKSYLTCGESFVAFLTEQGMPRAANAIAREHVEAYMVALSERVSAATVAKHYRSLQQLFRWLVEDGEISRTPFERMSAPAVPEQAGAHPG